MDSKPPESKSQWREFEKLAASFQQELAPDARVSPNVRIHGKRSGVERQIDILVEQTVGQYAKSKGLKIVRFAHWELGNE